MILIHKEVVNNNVNNNFQEVKLRNKLSWARQDIIIMILCYSKVSLSMLALVLLVVLNQLNSLKGATGLLWLVKSESDETDNRRVKEDTFVRDTLKQDAAPFEGEATLAIDKRTLQDTHEAIDEQVSRRSAQDQVGSQDKQRNKVLTRKILKALRKERERKRQEKKLLLHRLYLFQKPQIIATAASFHDFLNYFKGVGRRIKEFFTRRPVMAQYSDSEDSKFNQDLSAAELEWESDHTAQRQEIKEALVHGIIRDILKSAARSGRVSKRETVNDRDVLLQIQSGLPFVMQSNIQARHGQNSNGETALIAKDEEAA